eukprot:CAMPEP_0169374112 /NCGR_PEP_ID=MMETSP1017-20121227/37360_1 /TAXON_ID=342587 /ORGANISM="Karlodinium micrum, Strain CCMP2283" /LENGTH=416 /DNA_ID=CAMNT_0009472861 /DNA_START=64 /DNA_END=1311 /DNA_ORIENTATION=-
MTFASSLLCFEGCSLSLHIVERLPCLEIPVTVALLLPVAFTLQYLFFCRKTCRATLKQNHPRYENGFDATASTSKHLDASEYALSQKHGKYKHCCLRLDAFASEYPPSYSLSNLELPIPELSSEERSNLRALSIKLHDLEGTHHRTDDATLLRFLRARKGNVSAAEVYFRKSLAYRDEMMIPHMETTWNLEAYERCFAPWWCRGGIVGYSLKGGIVGWERFGICCFPQLLEAVPWTILQKLDTVHMVRTLAAFEEDSMRRGEWLGKAILVVDLDGMNLNMCKPSIAKRFGQLVEYRDMLMPNTLENIFVIQAPKAFSAAWSMVKHFLDPGIQEKVQIVSGPTESLALLRRYMSNAFIPGYLGGGLHVNGDPQCCQILGSDSRAPIPRDAIAKLLELASKESSSEKQELPVSRYTAW